MDYNSMVTSIDYDKLFNLNMDDELLVDPVSYRRLIGIFFTLQSLDLIYPLVYNNVISFLKIIKDHT